MQVSLRPGPGKIPGQALGPHRPYVWAWPGLAYIGPEARASGPQAQALTTLRVTFAPTWTGGCNLWQAVHQQTLIPPSVPLVIMESAILSLA